MTATRDRPTLRHILADLKNDLIGTFVLIPRVEIIEALGYAGFEAIVLDLEHGSISSQDLPPLVAAGQGSGLFVLARIAELSDASIGSVLDSGVDGIIIPHVSDASHAQLAVDAGRYPPDGARSLNPYVRAAKYWGDDEFTARANDSTAILVMVEGIDAIARLDNICTVPGVDAIFIGPVDLSASMGHPGQPDHAEVVAQIKSILARSKDLGAAAGLYCPDAASAARWRRLGARFCVMSADMAIAYSAFRAARKSIDDVAEKSLP